MNTATNPATKQEDKISPLCFFFFKVIKVPSSGNFEINYQTQFKKLDNEVSLKIEKSKKKYVSLPPISNEDKVIDKGYNPKT